MKSLRLKLIFVVFIGLITAMAWAETSTQNVRLKVRYQEEKSESSHLVTVFIKNVGESDLSNTEMDLCFHCKNKDEDAHGTISLNLSKGQEVKLPIMLGKTNKTDFFGITFPIENEIGEIHAVEITLGKIKFSSDEPKAGSREYAPSLKLQDYLPICFNWSLRRLTRSSSVGW
jgi:hypothetical protein